MESQGQSWFAAKEQVEIERAARRGVCVRARQVYGSDVERSFTIRAWTQGKMVMENTPVGPMLPRNTGLLPNANDANAYPDSQLFLAGGA